MSGVCVVTPGEGCSRFRVFGSVFGEDCTKLCRCKSSSEVCINHNGRCPGECAWSYGSFNCQQYNAALFKQVNMTGEKFFPGTGTELKHLTGDKAVDNDLSTDLSRCALAYRFDGMEVLIMTVDMGRLVRVNKITLLGVDHDHPLKSRLQLELDDQVCLQRDLSYAPPQQEDVTCESDMVGRILKLTSFHKMIKLCELQVWECTAGMFGDNCERECLCKDPEEACDRVTGKCHSGCRLAHRQANCQERNVALVRKCQQSSFRPTTGNTPGGFCQYAVDGLRSTSLSFCAETHNSQGVGWIQVDLGINRYVTLVEVLGHHMQCVDGSWGPECQYSCNCKDNKEVCHKVTGACQSDCPPGFMGTSCQEACSKDRYGINCGFDCPSCTTDGIESYPCDAKSGACQNCTLNSDRMTCRSKCEEGQFGRDCWVTCNCKDDKDCHEVTGVCRTGCKEGWYGDNCQMEDVAREPDVTIFDNTRGHLAYLKDGKLNGSCFTLRGKVIIRITLVKVTYINRVVFFLPKPRNAESHGELFSITIDNKECGDKFKLLKEREDVICDKHSKGIEIIFRGDGSTVDICEVQVYECARYMWGKDCKHQCNCAISTDECNRNNGTCDGHCDPRFRGAACQIQNMALQKPTRQSSLFYHDESQSLQYSFHAVDGNDDPSAGHCAVTQSLGESWWEVDLLSHVFINRITIVGQKYSTCYTGITARATDRQIDGGQEGCG
ncbi:hypothetical protein C0Q70_20396 [Pomacea canaliculata]|uniref:Fucolectin tachylectin-4 pentraxin-1 domain-containing protein n=1 Tax=Pomacea canaliculata TaxID=400727 RepID=A0A2T7NFJ5_POMCA|nr:hypothetical protein C0Q70_20396 [Pomacea canaliculata]